MPPASLAPLGAGVKGVFTPHDYFSDYLESVSVSLGKTPLLLRAARSPGGGVRASRHGLNVQP